MTTPDFINQINDKYQAGIAHAFVLHNNINDYVVPGVTLKQYLAQWLANRKVIVFYNRSRGFVFPTPSMETEFRALVGLKSESAPVNPALAALAQSRGQTQAQNEAPLPTSPEAALPLIEKFLVAAEPAQAAVVIEYAESIAPNADMATMSPSDRTNLVTLSRWGIAPKLEKQGQFILLITESIDALHDNLKAASSKYAQVEIEYPGTQARAEFINWYLEGKAVDMDLTPGEFANLTAGLNLMNIEDIFLRGKLAGKITAGMVKDRKAEIVSSEFGDVLEVLDPQGGFETIGGLDYIKEYFKRSVIKPMRAGNVRRVPMGVLMLGPAGTGKSIMATAVAKEAGINAVKLNIGGQIASKWQGEGERKLAKALRGVLNFAPTLVFIDEIDQTVNRGSGDNQQDSRIFQMLIEFMAETEHRGQVIFLGATNRPDLIDPALRRAGRFDDKIAFLVPSEPERQAIFEVFARKFGLGSFTVPAEAVSLTQGYTGAEIEGIARKAATLMEDYDLAAPEALVSACKKIKATTQAIEFMTALALAEVNDLDLLPPQYQGKAQDQAALEQIIEAGKARDNRDGLRQARG